MDMHVGCRRCGRVVPLLGAYVSLLGGYACEACHTEYTEKETEQLNRFWAFVRGELNLDAPKAQ